MTATDVAQHSLSTPMDFVHFSAEPLAGLVRLGHKLAPGLRGEYDKGGYFGLQPRLRFRPQLDRSPLRARVCSRSRCEPMLTIDFTDPATNADPFPIFGRLRESDPVHWSEPMKACVVTRYEDVKAIALN